MESSFSIIGSKMGENEGVLLFRFREKIHFPCYV